MKKVENIQELINKKAEERLDKELQKIWEFMESNPFLRETSSNLPDLFIRKDGANGFEYAGTKPYWLFQANSIYMTKIKNYFLPIYISEETEMFMKKIEDLRNDVDNLFDNRSNNDY